MVIQAGQGHLISLVQPQGLMAPCMDEIAQGLSVQLLLCASFLLCLCSYPSTAMTSWGIFFFSRLARISIAVTTLLGQHSLAAEP